MSWMSGACLPGEHPAEPDPGLLDAVLDLTSESFAHGRAVQRGDVQAAGVAHRATLVAVQAVLDAAASRGR